MAGRTCSTIAKREDRARSVVVVPIGMAGQEEPYEVRVSRTDLWGLGGEIPPSYPTASESCSDKR